MLRKRSSTAPLACVLGNTDLVRALTLGGVPCAVPTKPGDPVRYSRHVAAHVPWSGDVGDEDGLLEALINFGEAQKDAPILFYQLDHHLLFVSRHRKALREVFRFVIAGEDLVECLVDKARFALLAQELGLPVPRSHVLHLACGSSTPQLDLGFPLIIKPVNCTTSWSAVEPSAKARRVNTPLEFERLWARLVEVGCKVVAQELVEGSEAAIESYHVYIDAEGTIAGEFTGRKIRTAPVRYGYTTALEITSAADVARAGRDVIRRLGLTGVAKLDFKRAPDGRIHLLEVNPRFNLWHHPGAVAGVNLPALVWADLAGRTRPPTAPARPGVRWCAPRDVKAARQWGVPYRRWLPWMLGCEAKYLLEWDDPLPILCGGTWRLLSRQTGNSASPTRADPPPFGNAPGYQAGSVGQGG